MATSRSPADPEVVDLRSDTVTRPTRGMRRAIAEAEVGDDALGDDPTTRRLEAHVAELLGKEAALFFPSGVMANQAALAVLGRWGGEVIVEADAHVFHWEEGAAAALSGLQLRPVAGPGGGRLDAGTLEGAVRPDSPYLPRTVAVALENTHLASGGRILLSDTARELCEVARRHDLPVHLDGARLWHASVATGESLEELARWCDTVMVALSKGLGAPVGSVLAGPADVMASAWRVRRRLGGAMRQSGLLAAAGLYALDHHLDDLARDHENARLLADAFASVPGLEPVPPETNIVLVDIVDPELDPGELLSFLDMHRILMIEFGNSRLRAVTHRDVSEAGIRRAATVLKAWASSGGGTRHMA